MTYHPLTLPSRLSGPEVKLIRDQLEPHLEDVHTMLRLPVAGDPGLRAGCNFAIAQVLLAVVAGASVTLYQPSALRSRGGRGQLFREILTNHYPWNEELSISGRVVGNDAARILYDLLRNPLAHALGVIDPADSLGFTSFEVMKGSFAEADIEATERAVARPVDWTDPTLRQDGTKLTLWVRSFYWGVRRMIENVAAGRVSGGVSVLPAAQVVQQRAT